MSIEFLISKRNAKVKCDGIHTSEPHIAAARCSTDCDLDEGY